MNKAYRDTIHRTENDRTDLLLDVSSIQAGTFEIFP